MAEIIPLQAIPSQLLTVSLNDQTCQIKVYQLLTGLYLDLYVNDSLVIGGVLCENLNRIVRNEYLGFVGDLAFVDSEGTDDPEFAGLGDRFNLAYLAPEDL